MTDIPASTSLAQIWSESLSPFRVSAAVSGQTMFHRSQGTMGSKDPLSFRLMTCEFGAIHS